MARGAERGDAVAPFRRAPEVVRELRLVFRQLHSPSASQASPVAQPSPAAP